MDPHEFIVLQAIRQLNKEPDTWVWANLSVGDVKIVGWKPGMFKQVTPGVERGVADVVGLGPGGVHIEFEAKSGKSKTPNSALSTDQRRHRDAVLEKGGFYCAYGEPSEAVALYRAWLTTRR
jgi:hypothetical protein